MTATYVALLRGVNVGGRNKVAMADLRRLLQDLGHEDVRTYLQSGNAVFTTDRDDAGSVARGIERSIQEKAGLDITVVLRTPAQLAEVIQANPLPQADEAPTQVHVGFLAGDVATERVAAVDTSRFSPEELHPGPGVVYLWYPNGAGRAKLTGAALERLLGVPITARNWRSVLALRDLAQG